MENDGGGAGGHGDDVRSLLLRLVNEASRQMADDSVHTVEERTHRWMQESLSSVGERIRQLETSIHKMDERHKNRLSKCEERLNRLERFQSCSSNSHPNPRNHLEERVKTLELSVNRAFESVLPEVESLINQLNRAEPTNMMDCTTSDPVPTSSSSSTNPFPTPPPDLVAQRPREGSLEPFFMEACKDGRIEDINRLLDAGVDIDSKDSIGIRGLHLAVRKQRPDVVHLLICRGADIDAVTNFGGTALHVAAMMNCRKSVCYLLNAGADVSSRDTNGWTPLHWAAMKDSDVAIRLLLAAGANPNIRDNFEMLPLDLVGSEAARKLLRR